MITLPSNKERRMLFNVLQCPFMSHMIKNKEIFLWAYLLVTSLIYPVFSETRQGTDGHFQPAWAPGQIKHRSTEHSAQCGVAESPECVSVSLISWPGCSSPCLHVDCFQLSVWFASESGEQLLPLCSCGHVRFHSISSPLQHDAVLQANRYKGYNLP